MLKGEQSTPLLPNEVHEGHRKQQTNRDADRHLEHSTSDLKISTKVVGINPSQPSRSRETSLSVSQHTHNYDNVDANTYRNQEQHSRHTNRQPTSPKDPRIRTPTHTNNESPDTGNDLRP